MRTAASGVTATVAIAPCFASCSDSTQSASGGEAILEGIAEQLPADTDRAAFNDVYKRKYDWDMSGDTGPLWAIRPTRVFAFSAGGDFTGTSTRWTFDK